MKRIQLARQQFDETAFLTREQLKNVTGGATEVPVPCESNCISEYDCPVNYYCILVQEGARSCWRCALPDNEA